VTTTLRGSDVEPSHRLAELLRGASVVRIEARVSETHTRTTTVPAELMRRILEAALQETVER
jgi:hypothetical protein